MNIPIEIAAVVIGVLLTAVLGILSWLCMQVVAIREELAALTAVCPKLRQVEKETFHVNPQLATEP